MHLQCPISNTGDAECARYDMQRLATGEWFTSRVSACGLFATAYPRATPTLRSELRTLYRQLCRDDTPMVRRAAANKLGKFAETLEPASVSRDLIPTFQQLTLDGEQPFIPPLYHPTTHLAEGITRTTIPYSVHVA